MKRKDPFRTLDDPEPAAAPIAPEAGPIEAAPRSVLWINGRLLEMPRPRPGAWYRFWTRVLLGWKWQNL